ncbi:hypothetical protein GH714_016661 [Hevea brasiliensis]|uniref:Uncharacterized protein n=1 Tax=Hevea brasiliensis TaxID=3981 RepID=A0A6A6MCU2_HEVBR|nr:hypothetical protein GH714_016661 [Hevea brasiliensis]
MALSFCSFNHHQELTVYPHTEVDTDDHQLLGYNENFMSTFSDSIVNPLFEFDDELFYSDSYTNLLPYFSSSPSDNVMSLSSPDIFPLQEFESYQYPKRQKSYADICHSSFAPSFFDGMLLRILILYSQNFQLQYCPSFTFRQQLLMEGEVTEPEHLPRVLQRKHKFTSVMLKAATDRFWRKNLVVKSEGVRMYEGTLRDEYQDRNLLRQHFKGRPPEIRQGMQVPPWKQKLKVIMGVAEGMCHMQEQWPEVGHLQFWTSRVFLLETISNKGPQEELERDKAEFIEYIRISYPGKLRFVVDSRMKI